MNTDGEVQLMYFLFRYKNWEPQKYKQLGYGSKKIVRQFMYQQLEDMAKEYDALGGGNNG
ncbi:hypothetical protein EDD66_105306 [Mobilisporobacter senegalensis]|uniref:Uncharacterized protein n=1 Tax=Mobilisporobacter senegalensis TaxID=1329262 RepID=A0A3N1XNW0_9FIRM|nr:hypothetical protein [Mobilisporobacter senegalensis]ROR28364.1 hypothetical protein EDD66_105306 [Mobilisporobacter senegalensis]